MPITETIKKGQIKRKTGESSVEILRPETEAEIVIYDNTDSRLTSTDVQGALDELTDSNNLGASKIGYDNTDSGLTATDVQAAIDEIVSSGTGVTGVKGNAEQSYRTGQVNLTPANLGIALDTFASGDNASNKDRIEVGTDRINVVTTDTPQTISGVKTFTSTNTNFTKDIRFYPGTEGASIPYFSVGLDTNTDFIIGGNSSNISALGKIYLGAKGDSYNYISVKPTMAGWDHHIEFQDGAYNSSLSGAGVGYVKYKFPTHDKVESDSTPTYTIATTDDIPDVDDFVTGPSSASIGDIATYNNANGKVIKDSGWQIDGDHLYHNSNSIIISNGDTPFGGENYIGLQTLNLASLYIGRESDENTDTAVYAGSDASMDLGYKNASATRRFRDLYLSRNLTDGTNSVTIANIAKDDNVIHKGTSLSYAPAENRYGNLTIYGTDGQGLTSLIVNKDAVSAGSPGSMIPMRASKFVIQDEGNAWLSDKATYDATKITFRKNNSGTFTAYNLAFPSKSGTLAITDDCVNKVISGLNAAATPANIESTISGRTITLGDSGITAGTYSAIQVNAKGIAIAGGQILDVIAHGATPNVINGGWYFEEFATA